MGKYLKTVYNDKKVARYIEGCEQCPIMSFDEENFKCKCKCFCSATGDNVVDIFTISYNSITKVVNDRIKIPYWCGLPSLYNELINKPNLYTFYGKILTITPRDPDNKIPIMLSSDIMKKENEIYENFTQDEVGFLFDDSSIITDNNFNIDTESPLEDDDFDWEEFIDLQNRFGHPSLPKVSKVCSLCGEEHDEVMRDVNCGVCDKCLDNVNEENNHQIFINNFRLKRNINFSKEVFKKIKYEQKL